jgi:hypothetical protein
LWLDGLTERCSQRVTAALEVGYLPLDLIELSAMRGRHRTAIRCPRRLARDLGQEQRDLGGAETKVDHPPDPTDKRGVIRHEVPVPACCPRRADETHRLVMTDGPYACTASLRQFANLHSVLLNEP